MICPYCSNETDYSEEDLGRHVLSCHPEKGHSAEAFAQALTKASRMSGIYTLASTLTMAMATSGKNCEETLADFQFFCGKLDGVLL